MGSVKGARWFQGEDTTTIALNDSKKRQRMTFIRMIMRVITKIITIEPPPYIKLMYTWSVYRGNKRTGNVVWMCHLGRRYCVQVIPEGFMWSPWWRMGGWTSDCIQPHGYKKCYSQTANVGFVVMHFYKDQQGIPSRLSRDLLERLSYWLSEVHKKKEQ